MSWTPEDEKRLAEVRASDGPLDAATADWLLAKLDEEKRARTEAEATLAEIRTEYAENAYRMVRAESALAEERAKREAAAPPALHDAVMGQLRERERAEAAEARVAELEKQLAESEASVEIWRDAASSLE